MALNKYMHPRNIYKVPPDFPALAKRFEDFANISKVDVTGKVTIDFKDPHSLRVLTKCLLKSDFGLDVLIPEDRLVPTLPLRLNYILWIEDLLTSINRKDNIKGLDIGTGACAVYPLLAAVKNSWHMIGTETDQESLLKAEENIKRNNLQDLICLSKNQTATLIQYLFTNDSAQSFDFCMCNPPFYSNVQELCESRSPARLPPKNGFTGSLQELVTEGGELSFCRKMIEESKMYKDKILIFTTMVGHKYNLKELEQDLKSEGITYTSTEFCQGRVTRWGLAWTYRDYDIHMLVPAREKLRKKISPIVYLLPQINDFTYNFESVSKKLLDIIQNLKLSYKILTKRGNFLSLDVKAAENTWSNQRRKRRLSKQLKESEEKKPKVLDISSVGSGSNDKAMSAPSIPSYGESSEVIEKGVGNVSTQMKTPELTNYNGDESSHVQNMDKSKKSNFAEMTAEESIIHAFFKVVRKENDIILEMEFIDGTAGKEGLHQIMQYIKNNWK